MIINHMILKYKITQIIYLVIYQNMKVFERALLKHFMNDKDLFLNYHKQLESDDFDNQFFKRIYSVLEDFYAENDSYTISDMILYTDNDNLRDAIIALDNYDINQEPYDSEIEDYMNVINESKYGDTLEELNHKLREASRIGDVELQKYYLEQIVNKNKSSYVTITIKLL